MNKLILGLILFEFFAAPSIALAGEGMNREYSRKVAPSDYLLRQYGTEKSVFDDNAPMIDLGADLGIGADCGRVDVRGTMRAALKNMLDAKYFGNLGQNIVASSPLLITCYLSPTWCAILKHGQLSAHYLSQLRLDQCALIDRYTDNRTEDFYRERQSCVRRKIKGDEGNLESAMESCQNVYGLDLASWSGKGGDVSVNKLIESSAEWAGLKGDEAKKSTDLAKGLVGDTVVSKGNVSVDYGSKKKPTTPETHLAAIRKNLEDQVCKDLLEKIAQERRRGRPVQAAELEREIKENVPQNPALLDVNTIENLSYLPEQKRREACRKLSDAAALSIAAEDLTKALDVLTVAAQNPNLPPNRKEELEEKRRALKDSIDMTVKLNDERQGPIGRVMSDIGRAAEEEKRRNSDEVFLRDSAYQRRDSAKSVFFDCSDVMWCKGGR